MLSHPTQSPPQPSLSYLAKPHSHANSCEPWASYEQYRKGVLRIKEVTEVTGLGRSTIYRCVADGKFPKQRKLGARAVGWLAEEVFQWLAEREVV